MTDEIGIIGAGIGGLTTALILKQKGFDVVVYECAVEIKPVGTGIVLAINASARHRQSELAIWEISAS